MSAGIRTTGVTRLTAGSGITLSGNVGNITISASGGGGGSPGGSTTQIQVNSSGAFAGYASFTFDGVKTATWGITTASGTTTPAFVIQSPASTVNGTSPIWLVDGTAGFGVSVSTDGQDSSGMRISNSNTVLSFNKDTRSGSSTGFVFSSPYTNGNWPYKGLAIVANTSTGNSNPPLNVIVSGTWCAGFMGGALMLGSSIFGTNSNGVLQIQAATAASAGIAFGADSIQCSIYRSAAGVLNLSPSNVCAGSGSLTTTSTDGWLYLPTTSGAPTGTPNNVITGFTPCQIDATNGKIWAYYGGAWHFAALT